MDFSALVPDAVLSVWHFVVDEYAEHPSHLIIHLVLLAFLAYFALRKPQKIVEKLSEKEVDALIDEWVPEPLFTKLSERDKRIVDNSEANPVESVHGRYLTIHGKEVLGVSTFNFLGFLGDAKINEISKECIRKYGCGSCGPRGFYGSIDTHIHFEEDVAEFLGVDEVILYSYDFSTIASAIPAFAKRTDLIVCDEGVALAVQTGVGLSRSTVKWYRHNDMADLERVLREVEAADLAARRPLYRKFLVTEGIFVNSGTLCQLPKLVELKNQYRYRLIIEESASFGVLGATGRGVTEHFGVPMSEVLFITASLTNALGSVGGFCAGPKEVVNHQRLSGSGYCYSASLPPFHSVAGSAALAVLSAEPQRCAAVQANARKLHAELSLIGGLAVVSDPLSPIVHVGLAESAGSREADEDKLDAVVAQALAGGIAVARSRYNDAERRPPQPTIRVCASAGYTDDETELIVQVMSTAARAVLGEIRQPTTPRKQRSSAAAVAATPAPAPAAAAAAAASTRSLRSGAKKRK